MVQKAEEEGLTTLSAAQLLVRVTYALRGVNECAEKEPMSAVLCNSVQQSNNFIVVWQILLCSTSKINVN
jgi:hypothetical protein